MVGLARRTILLGLAAVCLSAAAVGCYRGTARTVSLADIDRQPGWTRVPNVRVIWQESEHECGVAALAMVLDRWGVPDAAADVRRRLPPPSERGIQAQALRRVARERGFRAYIVSAGEADLVNELRARRPVLVGLVQRYAGNKALTHYEVVVGVNEERRRVLLLDPGRGAREDDLAAFDREWQDAGRLALVVAPS
jgi:ABC-type bacteriocin/lantibiotic exporter with double-glycine peptidase domain